MAPKRKKALKAKKPMKRGGPIKPKKRKPSEFARIYGSRERVAFVKSLPCAAKTEVCMGPIQNAHTENGGTGRKGPYTSIIPLCTMHHGIQHAIGALSFADFYEIDYKTAAAWTERLWQAHKGNA